MSRRRPPPEGWPDERVSLTDALQHARRERPILSDRPSERVTGMEGTYRITRAEDGKVSATVLRFGEQRPIRHVAVHSPTGLETGYSGSGPADLALSLLADIFSASRRASAYRNPEEMTPEWHAWRLHQAFKARFIADLVILPGSHRDLDANELYEWAISQ